MLGIREIIIGVVLLAIAGMFGKGWFLKMYRDIKGIKTEMKVIDKEYENEKKHLNITE